VPITYIIPAITPVVSVFSHYGPFALMYFSALMDSVILLLLLLHCLHCTVIELFGYLHSCKCVK